MTINTEKPARQKKQKSVIVNTADKQIKAPLKTDTENNNSLDAKQNLESVKKANEDEEEKEKPKKPIQKKPLVKKTEAVVNAIGLPISTKDSIAICRFIKKKEINQAIKNLEQVLAFKKPIPMRGEIPHRKGKRMMSGRFPKNATEHFIKLLKNLQANANVNGLDNPIIIEAMANFASRPLGRFGSVKRKRTHIKLRCIEKKLVSKKIKMENKKNE